jgi:hypothetical protein
LKTTYRLCTVLCMLKFFRSIHNALRRTTIKTLPVIELTPRHFVRNGHMPCLDPLGRLPQLLAYAIGMSMEQTENPLVIFGHADAEGSSEERRALSMRRAMAVRALVCHDIREWMELSSQASIEEISLSLAGVAGVTGWDCNTNQQGHLHAGSRPMRSHTSNRGAWAKFGTPVQVDGLYSLACWHGVYHIVVEQIKKCLQREFPNHYGDGSGAWMAPSLGLMDGSGVVGCGSDFPLFRRTYFRHLAVSIWSVLQSKRYRTRQGMRTPNSYPNIFLSTTLQVPADGRG